MIQSFLVLLMHLEEWDPREGPKKKKKAKKRSNKPAVVDDGVEIGPSLIPNAGQGLFATREFARNELVTKYEGSIMTDQEARDKCALDPANASHMRTMDSHHLVIDGLREATAAKGKGGGSFANESAKPNCIYFARWNASIAQNEVYLKAKRKIAIGEEITTNYGRGYWKGIQPA